MLTDGWALERRLLAPTFPHQGPVPRDCLFLPWTFRALKQPSPVAVVTAGRIADVHGSGGMEGSRGVSSPFECRRGGCPFWGEVEQTWRSSETRPPALTPPEERYETDKGRQEGRSDGVTASVSVGKQQDRRGTKNRKAWDDESNWVAYWTPSECYQKNEQGAEGWTDGRMEGFT